MSFQLISSIQELGSVEDKKTTLILCGSLVYYTLNNSEALPSFIFHESRDVSNNKLQFKTVKEKLHVFIEKKVQEYCDVNKTKLALDIDYYLEAGKASKGALVLIGGKIERTNALIHLYYFKEGKLEKVEEKMNLHPASNWFRQDLQKMIDEIIGWDKDAVIHIAEEMPHRDLLLNLSEEISTIPIFSNKKVKLKYVKPKTEGLAKKYGLFGAFGLSVALYLSVTGYQQHRLTTLLEEYTKKEATLSTGALAGLENLDIIKAKQQMMAKPYFNFDEFSRILQVLVYKNFLIKDFSYYTDYIKESHIGVSVIPNTNIANNEIKEVKIVSITIFVPTEQKSDPYRVVLNILKDITKDTGYEFRLKQNGWKISKEVFAGDLKEGLIIEAEGVK